jgi:hypothetical protein
MENLARDEMRAQIEQALKKLAPGEYVKTPKAGDFDAFLTRRGPNGEDIAYFCDNEMVSVEFGGVGTHWEYNPAEEEEEAEVEVEAGEAEEPPDPKAIVKGVVQTTLEISTEKVFAAEYRKLHAKVSKLHAAPAFEGLKAMKGFKSVSWNGKFDYTGG